MKESLKRVIEFFFILLVLPFFVLYKIGVVRFSSFSLLISIAPGLVGIYIRRAWYSLTLKKCGKNLVVDFLGAFRTAKSSVGDNCYIGVNTYIGFADIGNDVMISGHTLVLSGKHQHGMKKNKLIAKQWGIEKKVNIRDDVWIGGNVTVMADVAEGTVVGAGSVVNKVFEPYLIIAGVPAKPIGKRR